MFNLKEKDGLFRSIFIAYLILILHVVLLAGVGLTVVLFKGVYLYLPWIMAGLGILILCLAWFFYRQIKNKSTDMKAILSMPQFQGKTVEIKLLGGLASFKIKPDDNRQPLHPLIENPSIGSGNNFLIGNETNQIEDKIIKLNALYEKDLITQKEFDKAKQNIIQG
jgi:hypothetical protein